MKRIFFLTLGLSLAAFTAMATSNNLFAQISYGSTFDGGTIQNITTQCTCSGSFIVEFKSYVDNQTHEYIFQYGATQLYQNYNISSNGNYFLDTHLPYGICLVINGNSCKTEGNPEGILLMIGTS